jgi:predicted RNase H-like nuclease (RuvC/YqgF family)
MLQKQVEQAQNQVLSQPKDMSATNYSAQIEKINTENRSLAEQVRVLQSQIPSLQTNLNEARHQLDEQRKLNRSYVFTSVTYVHHSLHSILKRPMKIQITSAA